MAYFLTIDGVEIRRDLEGERTLGEILKDDEARAIAEDVRVAVTVLGGIIFDLGAPVSPGQHLILMRRDSYEYQELLEKTFTPSQ